MWRTAAQFRNIRVVHGKDQIKIFEIAGQYASGALPGNVDAVGACGCNRAAVRAIRLDASRRDRRNRRGLHHQGPL